MDAISFASLDIGGPRGGDEDEDEDYDEEDYSVASQTIAFRSVIGGQSYQCDRSKKSTRFASSNNINQHCVGGSSILKTSCSSLSDNKKNVNSSLKYWGGTTTKWMVEIWVDKYTYKRVSVQLQVTSGLDPENEVKIRVATDGKELVINTPTSTAFSDPAVAFLYNLDNYMEVYNIQSTAAAVELMSRDSRVVARQKNLGRMTGRNPDTSVLMNEERIPFPFKVDFDFVTKEYDPIWNGAKAIEVYDEEYHIFLEYKQAAKDGYMKSRAPFSPGLISSTINEEEEMMDDGETIKTNDQNHQIPDHVSFMSVDSAFASDGSSYKPPVAPGGGSCCGDTEVLFQNVNDLETQVKEARDELEAINRNSEQEAESLNPRPRKRFVFPPRSPAKSAPPLHSGVGASIASGRSTSSTISKIVRKSGASVCGASPNKAATASTAATPKSFATAKSRNTTSGGSSSSVAGTTIKSVKKKKGKSKNGSNSSSSLVARSKKVASSSSLAGSKKSSGTAGPNTRHRAAKEKQQQQLNVETVDTFSL